MQVCQVKAPRVRLPPMVWLCPASAWTSLEVCNLLNVVREEKKKQIEEWIVVWTKPFVNKFYWQDTEFTEKIHGFGFCELEWSQVFDGIETKLLDTSLKRFWTPFRHEWKTHGAMFTSSVKFVQKRRVFPSSSMCMFPLGFTAWLRFITGCRLPHVIM